MKFKKVKQKFVMVQIVNDGNILQNINFELLDFPLVASIHISINNFYELKTFNETINYYFKEKIKIKDFIYNLFGLVLNKTINHYICLFRNNNKKLLINNDI